MQEILKKIEEKSAPLVEFLHSEAFKQQSFGTNQALLNLQQSIWWAQKSIIDAELEKGLKKE